MTQLNYKHLRVLNALIKYQSVTLAATHLHISPSTVSYILQTLRRKTGEVLFTRTRKGLHPESSAYQLSQLNRKAGSLTNNRKKFIITTYSPIEFLLSLNLNSKDNSQDLTPHFITMELSVEERLLKLRRREVDIDIGSKLPAGNSIQCREFANSGISLLVSKNHATIKNQVSLADWQNNLHLRWKRVADFVDNAEKQDSKNDNDFLDRRIACEGSNLLTLAWLCSVSNNVLVVPDIFIGLLSKLFPVTAFKVPGLNMQFNCYIHYHPSLHENVSELDIFDVQHYHGY